MKDTLNHQIYADRIAEEIIEHYSSEKTKGLEDRENIVFAISGKWGEGKTDLLNRIEEPLTSKGSTVIKFNPWKYAQDEITIKKAFLKEVRRKVNSSVSLDDLYFDKSETLVDWGKINNYWKKLPWFWITLIILILFGYIPLVFGISYQWLSETLFGFLKPYIGILTVVISLLIFPLIVKLLPQEFITKKSYARISTSEEFEDRFKQILKGKEKIVIFIDDIDRCTPTTIKMILDSLRTFFQQPECSFVVTGDHTVVEKAATLDLQLPDGLTQAQKLEEGRRYIKKLFNVYWRMPLSTSHQFGLFVDSELGQSGIKFKTKAIEANFKSLLLRDDLFARNPRNVKRFIDTVKFAAENITFQIEAIKKDSNQKIEKKIIKGLSEMLINIDLLAKILIIQEFFYPLYEKLVLSPVALIDIEKEIRGDIEPKTLVYKGDDYLEILGGDKTQLSGFVSLVKQSPRFTDENGTTIHEVANYFYFSASTGLPSSLGPDSTKFLEYLKKGQLISQLGPTLMEGGVTPEQNKEYAEIALHEFDKSEIQEEKTNVIAESLRLAAEIPEWAEFLDEWKKKVDSLPEEIKPQVNTLFIKAQLNNKKQTVSEFYKNDPNIRPILWDVVKEIAPETKQNLKKEVDEVARVAFIENPKDFIALENCLNIIEPNEVILGQINQIIDLEKCKEDFIQLKSQGLENGKLSDLYKKQMVHLSGNPEVGPWIIQNKDFLKENNIFEESKQNLIESGLSKLTDLTNLISWNTDLEMSELDLNKIRAKVILDSLINTKDLTSLTSQTIYDFLNKGDKLELFSNLTKIFIDKKEDIEKRKQVGSILIKGQELWRDFSNEDAYTSLQTISKSGKIKNPELKILQESILNSWEFVLAQYNT